MTFEDALTRSKIIVTEIMSSQKLVEETLAYALLKFEKEIVERERELLRELQEGIE